MSPEPRPTFILPVTPQLFCRAHFQRLCQPDVLMTLALATLAERLLKEPTFLALCEGQVDKVQDTMRTLGPICCYLGEGVVEDVAKACPRVMNFG